MEAPKLEAGTSAERHHERLRRDLGPTFMEALHDPKTIEIMLNPDGQLWQERLGEHMKAIGRITPERAASALRTIAACLNETVTADNPLLEGNFPLDGSRFSGALPPVVAGPYFTVRKKAVAIFTLEDYVSAGSMTADQSEVIHAAIRGKKSILISGGTASGKTTLVNALIAAVVQQDALQRFIIIEDTGELQCSASNKVQFYTTLSVSITRLVKATLRARPDRVVVGEVRGPEALDLLDIWNTGHPGGAATIHANNALSALHRLRSLVTRNEFAPKEVEPLIGEAVDLVVQIAKTPTGRKITEIMEVLGYEDGRYQTRVLSNNS